MARKPVVTRTFAPIHFEDLDPHRFEDLIRELIYDFRDWRTIEATGTAGSDDGFDIRAFEKSAPQDQPEEQDEEIEPLHPMDGPRWMIQGKREKTLTPSAVRKILADVDANDPPYGYILAASAVFSKASYDLFREELRKKGVMEFYLWGRSELEGMLHLPKNDRILFTFFGISLVSRRRSRTTEVRASVTTKNKLYKVLGDPQSMIEKNVLLRDINDVHYPYKGEYPDFDKNPRWIERVVNSHNPRGLLIRNREFYAFVDRDKKEWDFTDHTDSLVSRRDVLSDDERKAHWKTQQEVRDVWKFLPRAQQATFEIEALLPYADILIVDPTGDGRYGQPHLYAEFKGAKGPYYGFNESLSVQGEEVDLDESWRRVDFFPKRFPIPAIKPRIITSEKIVLPPEVLKDVREYRATVDTLYAVDGRFDFLRQRDIVAVADSAQQAGEPERHLQILHIHKGSLANYVASNGSHFGIHFAAQRQIGREVADEEQVVILEVDFAHPNQD
jgi:hypothetical protein